MRYLLVTLILIATQANADGRWIGIPGSSNVSTYSEIGAFFGYRLISLMGDDYHMSDWVVHCPTRKALVVTDTPHGEQTGPISQSSWDSANPNSAGSVMIERACNREFVKEGTQDYMADIRSGRHSFYIQYGRLGSLRLVLKKEYDADNVFRNVYVYDCRLGARRLIGRYVGDNGTRLLSDGDWQRRSSEETTQHIMGC